MSQGIWTQVSHHWLTTLFSKSYLVGHHALAAAFDNVILFTAQRYAAIQIVPFAFGDQTLFTYLFPLAALLMLVVCARDWHTGLRDRLLWSCAAFALAAS
jgi:hypothetical protein